MSNLAAGAGGDLPESQYEALFQVLTGAGRDLTNNGDMNDVGEIAPSNIGWTMGRSRVIYLLTDASFHDSDTEAYPGTPLEAAGRNTVLSLLMPNNPVIFTMAAENPGAFVTQGENGESPPQPLSDLARQAQELASETLGGVFFVGADSATLAVAIDATVEALEEGIQPLTHLNIDIKPGSDDNAINPSSTRVVPVAILPSPPPSSGVRERIFWIFQRPFSSRVSVLLDLRGVNHACPEGFHRVGRLALFTVPAQDPAEQTRWIRSKTQRSRCPLKTPRPA